MEGDKGTILEKHGDGLSAFRILFRVYLLIVFARS